MHVTPWLGAVMIKVALRPEAHGLHCIHDTGKLMLRMIFQQNDPYGCFLQGNFKGHFGILRICFRFSSANGQSGIKNAQDQQGQQGQQYKPFIISLF